MRRSWTSKLAALAIAIVGLSGCQDATRMVGPEAATPEISINHSTSTSSSSVWQILDAGSDDTGGVSVVIGAEGGSLSLGQQTLVVPAGAVDAPTIFTIKKGGSKLRVILNASRETTNDVGSAGFATPVYLTFSYGNVSSLPADPSELEIVWIRPNGTFEPQPTVVDEAAKTVTGRLLHFSEYALATN